MNDRSGKAPSAISLPSASEGGDAALVLADGTVFRGRGLGAAGRAVGEVCFNTSMTGYQEIMTDPSYAGQIITFTFPHIGNTGTNPEDIETMTPAARGAVLREEITRPSNWRALQHLDSWLRAQGLIGIAGVDTRALTHRIRDGGAPTGCIAHCPIGEQSPDFPGGRIDIAILQAEAAAWPGLEGMDLAKEVTCRQSYQWRETTWELGRGYGQLEAPRHRVVAVDFGAKQNILRCLAAQGCEVTVVPASSTAAEIMAYDPDGVFLSNGPGDPAATGVYAVAMVKELLTTGIPIFGICLGHQILALALGARTRKMHLGHRGANHPVKDLATGRVEITSQNHGFEVIEESFPKGVEPSHRSLFDGSNEGLRVADRPVFSVQYHPEASPGPQDSQYLFKRFLDMIESRDKAGR